jgi:hypothetical protein
MSIFFFKSTANIRLNGEELDVLPCDQKQGKNVSSLNSHSISYTGNPRQCNKTRKGIKGTYIKKRMNKTTFVYRSHNYLCRKCKKTDENIK